MSKIVSRNSRKWKVKVIDKREALKAQEVLRDIGDIDVKVALIQELIPIGIEVVKMELEREVERLAGERYRHGKKYTRWGKQGGSVYLLEQKVPIEVPRVRDRKMSKEVQLMIYKRLQMPYKGDDRVFKALLNGLSMRKYAESVGLVPEVFGLSGSTMSRRFKGKTLEKLKELQSRDLSKYDFISIFIDGKRFADEGILIILGITMDGRKIVLGIEQMGTENHRAVEQFLNKAIERGLRYEDGLLCVIDGSKGIRKAVKRVFMDKVAIQRCQWHKVENVVSYLSRGAQVRYRRRLQDAYKEIKYTEARKKLLKLADELEQINPSASASLREGMEETLTLHRLGVYDKLRASFSSTNCIESVLSQVEQYTGRVDYWRNGAHIQRWVAAGLLELEPRLRRVRGFKYLPLLRKKIKEYLKLDEHASQKIQLQEVM